MSRLRRAVAPIVLLAAAGLIGACASSGGSGQGDYRGVRVYERGQDVYVCRDAATAPSRAELVEKLEQGVQPTDPPTGQSVRVAQRETVQVRGSSTTVARVEAEEGSGAYWIPFTALCSRGSQD